MKMVRWLIPLLLLATQVFAAPVELDVDRNGFLDLARGGFNVNPATDPTAVKTILGLQYVSGIKHNFSATIPPTANTDSSINYSKGSLVVVIPVDVNSPPSLYVCRDATEGAAVWELVSGAGGSAMTPQEIVDAIDTLLGSTAWQAGGGTMTNAQVKTAYEANANTNAFTDAEKTKLAGVTAGATANSTDAFLRDRSNHTGTQPSSTISDAGATGRSILAATTPAEAQAAVGTIAADDARLTDTRDPNAHQHATTDLSASTAFGRSLVEAANAAAGRTAMGTETGYGVNQLPPLQALGPCTPLGVCTDGVSTTEYACEGNAGTWTPYDSAALCAAAGGSWGSAVGFKFSSASFPQGGLFVGDLEVVPGSASWAAIPDKPDTFPPGPHQHSAANTTYTPADGSWAVTEVKAALDALRVASAEVENLKAIMQNSGLDIVAPTVAITSSTADTTDPAYTLTGTATDNIGVVAGTVKYRLNGGTLTDMTGSGPYTASGLTLNMGSNTLYMEAKDAAGSTGSDTKYVTYLTPVEALSGDGNFGTTIPTLTTSAAKTMTFNNTGNAPTPALSVSLAGADPSYFNLVPGSCNGQVVAAGGSCNFGVTFSPGATANVQRNAIARVTGKGQSDVSLSGTGVSAVPTPTYYWPMLDNAASTTVAASVGGVNGSMQVNTSTIQTGSGFQLSGTAQRMSVPTSGAIATMFTGGSFTAQGTFKYVNAPSNQWPRFFDETSGSSKFMAWWDSSTKKVRLYINGVNSNDSVASLNFDDGTPRIVRVVWNAGTTTAKLFAGTNESNLVEFLSFTASQPSTIGGTFYIGGNASQSSNGIIRDVKLWNQVVLP